MMLSEIAKKYYLSGYNCAESLLLASNDHYGLGLTTREVLMMKGFGGGFGVGAACGAMTGALAALGLIYSTTKNAVEGGMRQDAAAFVREFEAALGNMNCSVVKASFFEPEMRCAKTVVLGADVLEKHIAELNK